MPQNVADPLLLSRFHLFPIRESQDLNGLVLISFCFSRALPRTEAPLSSS